MSWLFALAALLRPNLTSDRISSAYHADYALSVTVHGRSLGAIKTSIDDGAHSDIGQDDECALMFGAGR
eukprot:scaffold3198_cov213-Alexandrium_tamarense.AAC.14